MWKIVFVFEYSYLYLNKILTYLYLYLYLNVRTCICICIWNKFSSYLYLYLYSKNLKTYICICICIWKKRIWTQPWLPVIYSVMCFSEDRRYQFTLANNFWPLANKKSSRRQRSITLGGRYRQVSLYQQFVIFGWGLPAHRENMPTWLSWPRFQAPLQIRKSEWIQAMARGRAGDRRLPESIMTIFCDAVMFR